MEDFEIHISLGSACLATIEMRKYNIKDYTYCFDWLWNREGGLMNVITILENKFKKLLIRENYIEDPNFRVKNKCYSDMGFPHNKVLSDEGWETFKRRINRTKEILESDKKICFVYFRDITKVLIDKNYKRIYPKKRKKEILKEQIRLFKEETILFREKINILYPDLNYHLKALFMIDKKDFISVNNRMYFFTENKITYNIVIGENESMWKKALFAKKYLRYKLK